MRDMEIELSIETSIIFLSSVCLSICVSIIPCIIYLETEGSSSKLELRFVCMLTELQIAFVILFLHFLVFLPAKKISVNRYCYHRENRNRLIACLSVLYPSTLCLPVIPYMNNSAKPLSASLKSISQRQEVHGIIKDFRNKKKII